MITHLPVDEKECREMFVYTCLNTGNISESRPDEYVNAKRLRGIVKN